MKQLFGTLSKIEEQDDGTVKVYGVASSEIRDSDNELVLASAIEKALPDYLRFGAVREMHQANKASGTAIEAAVRKDGTTFFGAHIVDPIAVKKVRAKVYKGFSIGGDVTERNAEDPSIIEGIRLTEISLVDRPANPDATFSLVKFDNSGAPMPTPRAKDPVTKGMYAVGCLADLLDRLNSLQQMAGWEKDAEGDDSPVPDKLRSAVKDLGAILVEMVAEETAELTPEGDTMKVDKVNKTEGGSAPEAGTPNAAETANAVETPNADPADPSADPAKTEEVVVEDPPKTDDAPPADAETVKTAKLGELKKAAAGILAAIAALEAPAPETLAKVAGERDDLRKANADLADKLAKAEANVAALVKESDALVESLKVKGVLKVVGKSDDVEPIEKKEKGDASTSSVDAMKKVHASGGRFVATHRSPAGA